MLFIENYSTSVEFPTKFLLMPRHTCTSWFASALYLDYGRHGLFHDFPLDRHLKRQRKLKMNSFNLNGKTFQINLYRNYNQSGSILCGDKCVSMNFPSPAGGSTENLFKKILPISQVRKGV